VHSFDADGPADIEAALGGPPDIVVECVGKPGMLTKAVSLVRWGGTVLSMGMCVVNDTILPVQCAWKEVRMVFPLGYTIGEFVETLEAFDAGRVHPGLMVSDVIALPDLPDVIERMRGDHNYLKVQ